MSFVEFQQEDTIVSTEVVTAPLWSNSAYTLSSLTMFTSSFQETNNSGKFFLNVNNLNPAVSGSELQFAIAYGHYYGSGSYPFNTNVPGFTPTKDVYSKYYNLVYANEGYTGSLFNFGGANANSRDIFVINISRARYKESLKPGSLNLTLTNASGSIYLTDDSNSNTTTNFIGTNRVYNIVSGSNGYSYNTSSYQTSVGSYGIFLPDISTVILNPRALALAVGSGGLAVNIDETVSTSYSLPNNSNNTTLFNLIASGNNFSLNSQETISSKYYSVAAKYGEFNYTTNPSVVDQNGNIIFSTLINNPQTFVTAIGLYNQQNELMAVAKLNQPLRKDFTKTLTLNVKLQA